MGENTIKIQKKINNRRKICQGLKSHPLKRGFVKEGRYKQDDKGRKERYTSKTIFFLHLNLTQSNPIHFGD